jgi:T3SS negative regulator,GrlR
MFEFSSHSPARPRPIRYPWEPVLPAAGHDPSIYESTNHKVNSLIRPGTYQLSFSGAPLQNTGAGSAVICDGTINGGDPGFVYRGSYEINDGRVTARINVKRWNPISNPIANLSEYDLIAEGNVSNDGKEFSIEGHVQQHPNIRIKIEGKRLEDKI